MWFHHGSKDRMEGNLICEHLQEYSYSSLAQKDTCCLRYQISYDFVSHVHFTRLFRQDKTITSLPNDMTAEKILTSLLITDYVVN